MSDSYTIVIVDIPELNLWVEGPCIAPGDELYFDTLTVYSKTPNKRDTQCYVIGGYTLAHDRDSLLGEMRSVLPKTFSGLKELDKVTQLVMDFVINRLVLEVDTDHRFYSARLIASRDSTNVVHDEQPPNVCNSH